MANIHITLWVARAYQGKLKFCLRIMFHYFYIIYYVLLYVSLCFIMSVNYVYIIIMLHYYMFCKYCKKSIYSNTIFCTICFTIIDFLLGSNWNKITFQVYKLFFFLMFIFSTDFNWQLMDFYKMVKTFAICSNEKYTDSTYIRKIASAFCLLLSNLLERHL